jgi:very-short-patch-repair endonuclease
MWDDVLKKFNINNSTLNKAVESNLFKTRSKSESFIISRKKTKRYHSEEVKKKISISRTKYLKEHPEKVPYLLNHYSKGPSYPERYFDEIFNGKFEYEKYVQSSLYHIDFSITNKKIAIEIDGDQHYLDKKIVESDIRKNKYLISDGWDIIRIKWSDYQKMTRTEKEKYITGLLEYINNLSNNKPIIEYKDNYTYCINCGEKIWKTSVRCVKCAHLLQRKVLERPSKDDLILMVKETSLESVGRKYGVTGNSIKKWIK